jgi:DNA-binding MarR family transcriptional regulator
MSEVTPPLTGQEIALAANATRAPLDVLLAEKATTFHQWVILNFTGTSGGSFPRDTVVERMRSALKIDQSAASAAIEEVIVLGLAKADGDRLTLTPTGGERYEQIRAGSAAIVERLYAGLPIEDQLTTRPDPDDRHRTSERRAGGNGRSLVASVTRRRPHAPQAPDPSPRTLSPRRSERPNLLWSTKFPSQVASSASSRSQRRVPAGSGTRRQPSARRCFR